MENAAGERGAANAEARDANARLAESAVFQLSDSWCLFRTRIRCSVVSFPQNFGNGWFGGLLPAVAFTIVAATGNVFAGLWYPVGVAALCFVVGAFGLPETRGRPVE
ncbi:MAG: hypothetical protein WD793_07005 [Steroidobacteraceae bacterium]